MLVVVLSRCITWYVHALTIFSFKGFKMVLSTWLRNYWMYLHTSQNCTTTSIYDSSEADSTIFFHTSMMVSYNFVDFTYLTSFSLTSTFLTCLYLIIFDFLTHLASNYYTFWNMIHTNKQNRFREDSRNNIHRWGILVSHNPLWKIVFRLQKINTRL